MDKDDITTATAAELLGVDPSRVRQLLRDGIVRGRMLGRDWIVSRASVEEYRSARRPPGRPPSSP